MGRRSRQVGKPPAPRFSGPLGSPHSALAAGLKSSTCTRRSLVESQTTLQTLTVANSPRVAVSGSQLRRACLVTEKTSAITGAMSEGDASLFGASGELLSSLGPPLLHHIRDTLSALRGEAAALLGW
jgi:hypothetical protein